MAAVRESKLCCVVEFTEHSAAQQSPGLTPISGERVPWYAARSIHPPLLGRHTRSANGVETWSTATTALGWRLTCTEAARKGLELPRGVPAAR